MSLTETLDALYAEADELKTKDGLSEADITRADEVIAEIEKHEGLKAKQDDMSARLAKFKASSKPTVVTPGQELTPAATNGSLGERFIKSQAFQAFRSAEHGPVVGRPIDIKSGDLGAFHTLRKATGDPAPVSMTVGGGPAVVPVMQPGILDLTYLTGRRAPSLLNLIGTGNTSSQLIEYRREIAVTNNAALVPENTLKPLSSITFDLAQAIAYTYADGFKVTNQELADDGVMALKLNTTLQQNLALKIEDVLLNGATGGPTGILNTTGVLHQAYTTDAITTLRKALTNLQTSSETDAEAYILNPADFESLSLLKDSTGRYLGNGPFGTLPDVLWTKPLILSFKVPVGTALVGKFSSIQLLDLEGLNVQAFNQNEDDARFNRTYIRAEQRSLLLIPEPARICVAALTSGS